MSTSLRLISRSLRMVGVLSGSEMPSAAEAQDALESLNDLLASWMMLGIPINSGDLALDDVFPIDVSEGRAVRYALAIELAEDYGVVVSAQMIERAQDLRQALILKYDGHDEGATLSIDRAVLCQSLIG